MNRAANMDQYSVDEFSESNNTDEELDTTPEDALEIAFHMSGVTEYLEYLEWK